MLFLLTKIPAPDYQEFTVAVFCQHCNQVETDRISKYVLEIKDVLEFKDART